MRFAKNVFTVAGVYGLVVLIPQFFLEKSIGLQQPPAITHPEYFYGFAGVGIAWQIAFLIIGRDPVRYRGMMIPCMVEKFSFAIACTVLLLQGRLGSQIFAASMIDLTLGLLFVASYVKTSEAAKARLAAA